MKLLPIKPAPPVISIDLWDVGCGIWDMGSGIWDMGYGIWDVEDVG